MEGVGEQGRRLRQDRRKRIREPTSKDELVAGRIALGDEAAGVDESGVIVTGRHPVGWVRGKFSPGRHGQQMVYRSRQGDRAEGPVTQALPKRGILFGISVETTLDPLLLSWTGRVSRGLSSGWDRWWGWGLHRGERIGWDETSTGDDALQAFSLVVIRRQPM
jgi:hypothetical protein